MNMRGALAESERIYLSKRYRVLWRYVASRAKFKGKKRGANKPLHLIFNELKQRGETGVMEALELIIEDAARPYDPLRITFLTAVFFSKDR
jgi:hypothetical protein